MLNNIEFALIRFLNFVIKSVVVIDKTLSCTDRSSVKVDVLTCKVRYMCIGKLLLILHHPSLTVVMQQVYFRSNINDLCVLFIAEPPTEETKRKSFFIALFGTRVESCQI